MPMMAEHLNPFRFLTTNYVVDNAFCPEKRGIGVFQDAQEKITGKKGRKLLAHETGSMISLKRIVHLKSFAIKCILPK